MVEGSGKTARVDVPSLVVAALLAGVAALLWRDAAAQTVVARYGLGPDVMPRLVAGGLALLSLGHVVQAFRGGLPKPDTLDGAAFAWLATGLLAMIFAVAGGLGFVMAVALVFAATARAFAAPRASVLATRLMQAALAAFAAALMGSAWAMLLGPVGSALAGFYGPVAPLIGHAAALALLAALAIRPGRAGLRDIALGVALGVAIYLLFSRGLTLSLPQGPLERYL